MNLVSARDMLQAKGQLDILTFWDHISDAQKQSLLLDIEAVDWDLVHQLAGSYPHAEDSFSAKELGVPPSYSCQLLQEQPELDRQARQRGGELLHQNRVAALTVAGGQGTRLGFEGPKGLYPVTPVKHKSLFQHFAESILATNRRYDCEVLWFIMTSPENHEETIAFFQQHHFFSLPPDGVRFFQQGVMPAVSTNGKVLLSQPHQIALAPDGHGGTLKALHRSGSLSELTARGIQYLSYFQVDNPLITPLDPLFIGLVNLQESEFGSKAVRKAYDDEKVGVFVSLRGSMRVIEYTNFPGELCANRNQDGTRTFDFANIACHILDTSFVERIAAAGSHDQLPYHRASKKVAHTDLNQGERIEPTEPNAIKFEQFIFDAIPLAANPLILEVLREDEFSPVKNAEGVDSPATARQSLISRAVKWIEHCGISQAEEARASAIIEISPLFALDAEELKSKLSLGDIQQDVPVYLGPS